MRPVEQTEERGTDVSLDLTAAEQLPLRRSFIQRVRQIFRYAMLGLILLAVAMLSAVTAMRFAIHGREVSVPRVIGKSLAQAQETAEDLGLVLSIEDRFFSAEIARGSVITQVPEPGVRVRRGGRLRVAESLGPSRAGVPNLIGQTARAAEINLQRRGLQMGSVSVVRIPGLPPGQVIAQAPSPSSTNVSEPRVNLLFSAEDHVEKYLMPNLVGQPFRKVAEQVEKAGMKLKVIGAENTSTSAVQPPTFSMPGRGVITRQLPIPGSKVAGGSVITVEISD